MLQICVMSHSYLNIPKDVPFPRGACIAFSGKLLLILQHLVKMFLLLCTFSPLISPDQLLFPLITRVALCRDLSCCIYAVLLLLLSKAVLITGLKIIQDRDDRHGA